jgi:hypothetical protein
MQRNERSGSDLDHAVLYLTNFVLDGEGQI